MKRVSIMIDEQVEKKLRLLQSKLISQRRKGVSFSHVVNLVLKKNLK